MQRESDSKLGNGKELRLADLMVRASKVVIYKLPDSTTAVTPRSLERNHFFALWVLVATGV